MTNQTRIRYQVRFRDLLAAEWGKLWSLRSTPWMLLLTVLGVVAINADADYQNYPHYGAQIKAAFVPWWVMRDAFTYYHVADVDLRILCAGRSGHDDRAWMECRVRQVGGQLGTRVVFATCDVHDRHAGHQAYPVGVVAQNNLRHVGHLGEDRGLLVGRGVDDANRAAGHPLNNGAGSGCCCQWSRCCRYQWAAPPSRVAKAGG